MDPYSSSTGESANSAYSHVAVSWQRLHGDPYRPGAPWLLTQHGLHRNTVEVGDRFPQTRACVDDFGSLQIVTRWL